MSIRIVLADDHRILREGLRSLLEGNEGFEVVAEADDGRAAVQLAKKLKPDVVIMDITMPNLNGIDATRQILASHPGIRILALSIHYDKRFVVKMIEAGAHGYLRKDCASRELLLAIRSIMSGKLYLGAQLGDSWSGDPASRAKLKGAPLSELTPREREVLQLVAEGKTSREIAERLSVSVKAIEKHRQSILEKLNLSGVAELTRYAIAEGIITLDS